MAGICPETNTAFSFVGSDCSNPPPFALKSNQPIGTAPSGQPNAVNQNPNQCGSILGNDQLGKAVCLLTTPQFWKLAAIVFVGVLLIGSGLLLAVGSEVAGMANKSV